MNTHDVLLAEGAAIYRNALSPELTDRVREFSRAEVEPYRLQPGQPDAGAAPVYPWIPEYQEVIQRGREMLNELGFADVRWLAGALIPKWQNEGRRGWHIDWWGWEGSVDSYRQTPPQIGVLFYLDRADKNTGALIVMPGSHRRQIPNHLGIWETWGAAHGEKTLEANAGDAVLLDPRALHAVTANSEVPVRNCLTMWYLVDYAKLSKGTRATCMLSGAADPKFQSALGDMCPDFVEGDFQPHYFPHCKKPQFPIVFERLNALRGGRTDRSILGDAVQPGDDFVDTNETYSWYFAIGAAKAPKRIIEFGVRYGYSALAMGKGARWAGVWPPMFLGVDLEADGIASNAIAEHNIEEEYNGQCRIIKDSTLTMNPELLKPTADIIHVDGDHSPAGVARELYMAEMFIKPDGLILVDDMDVAHVHDAAVQMGQRLGIVPILLPTQHGLAVIDMAKRSKYEVMAR